MNLGWIYLVHLDKEKKGIKLTTATGLRPDDTNQERWVSTQGLPDITEIFFRRVSFNENSGI